MNEEKWRAEFRGDSRAYLGLIRETLKCVNNDFSVCNFQGGVDFGKIKLREDVFFDSSVFGSIEQTKASSFNQTEFDEKVSFKGATVNDHQIHFSEITVGDLIDFSSIQGNGEIKFYNAKLASGARILFKSLNKNSPQIIFEDCQFDKNQVVFRNCDMSKVSVNQGTYEGFTFENCTWPEITVPDWHFFKIKVANESDYKSGQPPNQSQVTPNELKERYQSLKIAAKNSGDSQLESDFYFSQMYWSLKERFDWIKFAYYHLSAFGLSIWSPLILWVSAIWFFSLAYLPLIKNQNFLGAFDLSFAASTVLFDPTRLLCPNNGLDCLTSPQTSIAYVIFYFQKAIQLFLLFEFGAAIRNKVKR